MDPIDCHFNRASMPEANEGDHADAHLRCSGLYLSPKCRIDDKLPCEFRGREVKVKYPEEPQMDSRLPS